MPIQYQLEQLPADLRSEAYRLWGAFMDMPDDLLSTKDGFYLTFDAYLQHILLFRLRPTWANLAVEAYLTNLLCRRRLRCANPVLT
jgi:hypothetical protein